MGKPKNGRYDSEGERERAYGTVDVSSPWSGQCECSGRRRGCTRPQTLTLVQTQLYSSLHLSCTCPNPLTTCLPHTSVDGTLARLHGTKTHGTQILLFSCLLFPQESMDTHTVTHSCIYTRAYRCEDTGTKGYVYLSVATFFSSWSISFSLSLIWNNTDMVDMIIVASKFKLFHSFNT